MNITLKQITDMKPCQDRLNNFIKAYPDFVSSDLEAFLALSEISSSDKIWVLVRLMTKTQKIYFAMSCAYSTLSIFESRYPDDKRPREVLDFLSKFKNPATLTKEDSAQLVRLRVSATTNVAAAYYGAAYAAAYAATTTIADAVNVATDAAAAYAAAYAATTTIAAAQEELNLIFAYDILVNSQ